MSTQPDAEPLREELRQKLRDAGLSPPAERVSYLNALIRHRGEVEMGWLRKEVGRSVWDRGLKMISASDPERSILWTLGHGSFLTEFAIQPLKLDINAIDQVSRLGARANLIVSLYDNFLDQGFQPSEILRDDFSAGSRTPLIGSLVKGYFRAVQSPVPLLQRTIRTMYAAENKSVSNSLSPRLWRQKCALPFVVMGLGGWGFRRPEQPLSHLTWLYRTGSLIGWIDDAADVEKDVAARRLNRFRHACLSKSSGWPAV